VPAAFSPGNVAVRTVCEPKGAVNIGGTHLTTLVSAISLIGSAPAIPVSRPDFVTGDCGTTPNARACGVALRYLAALDLDRAGCACALLERSTLEAAGGIAGCVKTLSQARGIRIHYWITAVMESPLGRTVSFSTRAHARRRIRQQMLGSPAGRIIAIVPVP
jgi:hypothetical protein